MFEVPFEQIAPMSVGRRMQRDTSRGERGAGFVGARRPRAPFAQHREIVGAVWAIRGRTGSAWVFRIEGSKITGIELIMDPVRLSELDLEVGG